MYELNVNSRKQLERASLRAQAQKPRIVEVGLGMYNVWSTNPQIPNEKYYTGVFPATDGNGYDVTCSCPTTRAVCKHVASIFPHYLMRIKQFDGAGIEVPTFAETVTEIKATNDNNSAAPVVAPVLDFCFSYGCDGKPTSTGLCLDCEAASNNFNQAVSEIRGIVAATTTTLAAYIQTTEDRVLEASLNQEIFG